jgi:hypothetical protein
MVKSSARKPGEHPFCQEEHWKVDTEPQVDKDGYIRRSTMECDRCHGNIGSGEEKQHLGQTLCEDCYMDALSPVRTCDPWAVHSAKSFEKHAESPPALTMIQSEILSILKETGGIEPQALLGKLKPKLTQKELEREFAALRHMEKARGEKRGGRVVWRLW